MLKIALFLSLVLICFLRKALKSGVVDAYNPNSWEEEEAEGL